MSEEKNIFQDSYTSGSKENKFVIIVDDTKDCCENKSCRPQIVQGHPIQQVYIDLSDCKKQEGKSEHETKAI